ncbi:DUF4380 domain-containing protein [Dyadobacter bucti]|uniref:DUF4380 domain-containing protein n=1 Tax=Dyadobacter bucti TaxID=2572203 RepID=UPI003F6FC5DF
MKSLKYSGLRAIHFLLVVTGATLAATAQDAFPVEKGGKYSISLGDQRLEIDPATGGRVTSLLLHGRDFLTDSTVNNFNWGSTFWLSPQSDWNWPPSAEIDNKPYTVQVAGKTISMTSAKDPGTGLTVTKEISGDAKTASFLFKYIITNRSDHSQKAAPWEVTRVKPGGIAFFPTGNDQARGGLLRSATVQNGIFWYTYQTDKLPLKGDRQIYADGSKGWLAQVNEGVILIKKFPDIPLDKIAPKEGEIELFASEVTDSNPGYVEIEHQGPYEEIQPGASLTWETVWYLRKLPAGIREETGDGALAGYVQKIVK